MGLPQTSACSKIIAGVGIVATILYIVGFACPYWLQKNFIIPAIMTGTPYNTDVDASMGLLESCKELTDFQGKVTEDCSSEGAADWQWVAAGFGIAGLAFSVFSCTLAILRVVVKRVSSKRPIRLVIICLFILTAGCMATSLILYALNKKMKVDPRLPLEVDFDLYWAFGVAAASSVLFGILALLGIIDIIWSQSNGVGVEKEEIN